MIDRIEKLTTIRKQNIQRGEVRLKVPVEKKCTRLRLSAKKIIALKDLLIRDVGGTLLEGKVESSTSKNVSGSEFEGASFIAQWQPENDYWYEVRFAAPVDISSVEIIGYTKIPSTDWIFHCELLIANDMADEPDLTVLSPANLNYEALKKELEQDITRGDISESEVDILCNVLYRRNPKETFIKLQNLNSTLVNFDLVMQLTEPTVLTPHGFTVSLNNGNKPSLLNNLQCFVDDFKELGYEIFVNSGTLLGAVRDNDFIPHDDDVDFAIILKSSNLTEAVAEMQELEKLMRAKKLIRGPHIGDKNGLCHWKLKYVNSTNIDLFPCWIEEGRVHVWPYSNGDLPEDALLPLGGVEIDGKLFPAPRSPAAFLEVNYGPSWSQPDPLFRFDWKSASATFSEFVQALRRSTKQLQQK